MKLTWLGSLRRRLSRIANLTNRENHSSNPSGNTPFAEILEASASRRTVIKGSLMTAAAGGFLAPAAAQASTPVFNDGSVSFRPVEIDDVVDTTQPTCSPDYEFQVLIPWGTPITPGATVEFTGDPNNRPTSEEAALQIGLGHDGMWFFPENTFSTRRRFGFSRFVGNKRGMLCVNHEFGTSFHALGKIEPETLEDVRIVQHVHGVSVVALERNSSGEYEVDHSPNARRIHVNTPVTFSGPVAGTEYLDSPAGNAPLGTVNNCGSGPTPWGTYLTCEENFNGYFGDSRITLDQAPLNPIPGVNVPGDFSTPARPTETEADARYGFSARGFGYGWYNFDPRFDLANEDYVNERNRFGWVVEIDPNDGTQTPVKRTALGRFKHEAIAIAVAENGRIAAYMGDDQRFDYCYKFVSDEAWEVAIANGRSPLDAGVLFVARFNEDGTGDWLPLTMDNPVLSALFDSQAEILVNARLAADALGATPMDRPEWTTIGQNKSVFWTLTNNSQRGTAGTTPKGDPRPGPDAANPEGPNSDGHIIRTVDADDFLGDTFSWEIFVIASTTRGTEGVFTDPDAAYADPFGRLFIGTDGGQPDGLQDQLVVYDTREANPTPSRLFVGVNSDEITGWTVTSDFRVAFLNIQHPGNGDPASTNFPAATDGVTIPRDCTIVLKQKFGGIIGS